LTPGFFLATVLGGCPDKTTPDPSIERQLAAGHTGVSSRPSCRRRLALTSKHRMTIEILQLSVRFSATNPPGTCTAPSSAQGWLLEPNAVTRRGWCGRQSHSQRHSDRCGRGACYGVGAGVFRPSLRVIGWQEAWFEPFRFWMPKTEYWAAGSRGKQDGCSRVSMLRMSVGAGKPRVPAAMQGSEYAVNAKRLQNLGDPVGAGLDRGSPVSSISDRLAPLAQQRH
jgi:hypothetical protein